ncbi:MAG: hypothetical protein JSU96_09580 [Acidobacteriota bacterium]|nr:MAG: hypothetical protein JSU96_09580 [Acidobacteriota bacterium]
MMIPLLSALLLSTSLTGSWRVILEERPELPMHIVVTDTNQFAAYDPDWSPASVVEFKVGEDSLSFRTIKGGTLLGVTLEGQALGDLMTGKTISQVYQYTTESSFRAVRISDTPFSRPPDWVSEIRKNGVVDLIGYLVEKAPRTDFETFRSFWQTDAEPRFYMFIHSQLYGDGSDNGARREEILRQVFESLAGYSPEILAEARKGAASKLKKEGKNLPDSVVLVPPALVPVEEGLIKFASLDNPDACCGAPSYFIEEFLYLPVESASAAR